MTPEHIHELTGMQPSDFLTADGEPYPLYSQSYVNSTHAYFANHYPLPANASYIIQELGEQCCECPATCTEQVDPPRSQYPFLQQGQVIVNEGGKPERKGLSSFQGSLCGESPAVPAPVKSSVWDSIYWIFGLQAAPATVPVAVKPDVNTTASGGPSKCGCKGPDLISASEAQPAKCAPRRVTSAFGTAPFSIMQAVVPPRHSFALGPILFKPPVRTM